MILKKCGKCGEEKPLSDFHKQKKGKHGVCGRCKKCIKQYHKQRYEEIKDNKKRYDKQYYQENKERKKQYQKQYYQENKERKKDHYKQYCQKNKERIKQYHEQYRQKNKERIKQYKKQRRQSDPMFKLRCNLGNRTSRAFKVKGFSKNSKTREILGVEWEVVKKHIERQFTKGMSWDNYGKWHVDHIVPLASAKTEEEVVKLCHYSNLQPLWAEDNLSKNDKIEPTQVKLRI